MSRPGEQADRNVPINAHNAYDEAVTISRCIGALFHHNLTGATRPASRRMTGSTIAGSDRRNFRFRRGCA
jgi:hypothetical protein